MSYIQNGGSGGGGSGTVTSVGLGADSGAILVVSGSPVTTSGTLQLQFNTEPANTVFAGPTSGPNATPTFRALVTADLPAGTGTVTSFSAGALSPIFTTSVATPTTTPALTISLSNAAQNAFLAGPSTGGTGAPTYRAIVAADIPSGTVIWNAIGNAAGNLTLANGANTTTFNQTSGVAWIWANTTAGTNASANASPLLELSAQYYTGSVTGTDLWTIQSSLAAGTNGASTLTFAHTGSTGALALNLASAMNISWNVDTFLSRSSAGKLLLGQSTGASNGIFETAQFLASGAGNAASVDYGLDASFSYGMWLDPAGAVFDVVGFAGGSGGQAIFGVGGAAAGQNLSTVHASGVVAGWSSTATLHGTIDTALSRIGAGIVGIGTGAQGNTAGTLALSRINAYSADFSGVVTSAPTNVTSTNVVVAVGGATGTFTVNSTDGFTTGDTVTLSATGWSAGSGLASSTATVTTITGGTVLVLTRATGGPWIAGTYTAQTGTLTQTGGTTVTVTYATAYTSTPIVTLAPTSNAGAFYISASSTTGFTITYANSGTQTFNYMVFGNPS
jgi:hypothetical protein